MEQVGTDRILRGGARDVNLKEPSLRLGLGSVPAAAVPTLALLTGGGDKPYAIGMASTLVAQGIAFDFIGSDEVNAADLPDSPFLRFFNLRGDQRPDVSVWKKVWRVASYYARLMRYALTSDAKVFHILWHNKLELLDRTLVLFYYRLLGKRIVFTAHNVNARERDGNDTVLNRLTLRIQYRLFAHIFVHTEGMKHQLHRQFGVPLAKISVIPFGINETVPNSELTRAEARDLLGLSARQRTVLFFGNIAPYKGLEYLVEAMVPLARTMPDARLMIVGRPKGAPEYWQGIQERIVSAGLSAHVLQRIEYVPDSDTEIYFKAADVLVLPYTHVFQSGVLFLSYNFGVPVIASDVGSLRDDIVEGQTGFVCRARNANSLAETIGRYFSSELYANIDARRGEIRAFAAERSSWDTVGAIIAAVYEGFVAHC